MTHSGTYRFLAAAALSIATQLPSFAGDDSRQLAVDLLQKGLVNGDTAFISDNVDAAYIQHNPTAPDGQAGLLGFVEYLGSLANPVAIDTVRVLVEDDLVLVHSEYALQGPKAVFDLFRVADGKLVEHWDAIQDIPNSTVSGRSMTDGPVDIVDRDKTQANKALVVGFVEEVLIGGKAERLAAYIGDVYHQHNPNVADGLEGLGQFIDYLADNEISFGYHKIHRVVAEGNFVFTQSEGEFAGNPTAYYDLFRVDAGKLVEHWDVIQPIPTQFAHDNGMF